MLISEKTIRRIIKNQLLKEISDEKWEGPAGEEYRKIYNSQKDTRKDETEYFKDKKKGFKYNVQSGLKPTYLSDLKKWWYKNADQDFFNNTEDLKERKEEVVVIHSLSAYEGEQGLEKDFLKYCEERERYYKNPNSINKNELSALGFINSEKKDAHEICKEKIGKGTNAGTLNIFLYLNTRKITAAGEGSGDLGTETFGSYAENDDPKGNKKLLKKKEFLKKLEDYRNSLDLKMNSNDRWEKLGINAQDGNILQGFIESQFQSDNASNFIKYGQSNARNLKLDGIFSKENDQYSDVKQLINDYKDIISFDLNQITCSEDLKTKLHIDKNEEVYIKENSILILFDLIFFNIGQNINTSLSNIFISKNEMINEKFQEKDIQLNENLARFISKENKELLEIYKKIWLSCLKKFFEKNIEKLKLKNIHEENLNKTLSKENENFLKRYENPFSQFSFEDIKNKIDKKKLHNYISSISGGDVNKSYKDATKHSGTRKYPAVWQYSSGNNSLTKDEKPRNILDSNILDREELKDAKNIDEVIVGNWKINSVWFNMDFNKINNLDIFEIAAGEIKDKDKKFMIYNLCFFLSKGFKCFDKNGLEYKGKIKKTISYSKENITDRVKEFIKKSIIKYEKAEISKEELTNLLNQLFDRFPSIEIEDKKKTIMNIKNSIKFVPDIWPSLQQMFTDKVSKLNAQLNSKEISKEDYQEKLGQLKKYAQAQGLNSYSLSKLFDHRIRTKRHI